MSNDEITMRDSGKNITAVLFTILLLVCSAGQAQEKKWQLNGYVKDLQMLYLPKEKLPGSDIDQINTNTIHNRLNFKWYPSEKTTFVVEMRNRLMLGNLLREYPEYSSTLAKDPAWLDLSWVTIDSRHFLMHTMTDRAYVDYSSGNWQFRIGRQRINWGINFVWNPNDVFNTFSYFDFDYEERPGTDAIKIQYYTSTTSSAELVFKMGRNRNHQALAGLYRFTWKNYDFQFLSGITGNDFIAGAGWSGDIKGAGFRGEITQFIPVRYRQSSEAATIASVSADYTFKNSLYLHGSFLFNSPGTTGKAGGRDILFSPELSVRQLSYARYALFGQLSYPFTPLFSGGFSGILNPSDGSFYAGPAFTLSLQQNIELMLSGQLFFGKKGSEFGDIGQLAFARLRWSF